MTIWVSFCRRTNDPKLAYIEHRLTEMKIPHRRNGESFHSPILEVPDDRHAEAYELLNEPFDEAKAGEPADEHGLIRLDDVPDDDPAFEEYQPHDWIPK
jgi:hypothetical protein